MDDQTQPADDTTDTTPAGTPTKHSKAKPPVTPLVLGTPVGGQQLPYLPGPQFFATADGKPLQLQVAVQNWQGPYPPPEAAERFERLAPGAFSRILAMAEAAQASHIATVTKGQEFARRDVRRAHLLGFLSTMAAMTGALVALYFGSSLIAGLFLGVPVLAVGKALVDSAHSRPPQTVQPNAVTGGSMPLQVVAMPQTPSAEVGQTPDSATATTVSK